MSLYFSASMEDLGFQREYIDTMSHYGWAEEQVDENTTRAFSFQDGEIAINFRPDYTEGIEVFVDTFLQVAQNLVPVDTGRLLLSISAEGDDFRIVCRADTDYAQYIEYGTYKMAAQPFFEPALQAALDAAMPVWMTAIEQARADAKMEAIEAEDCIDPTMPEELAGGILDSLFMMVIMILIAVLQAIVESIFDAEGSFALSIGFSEADVAAFISIE